LTEPAAVLPAIFVPSGGRDPVRLSDPSVGLLLRDLDLFALQTAAESGRPLLAVDLDSVEGLGADAAAVSFVVERLGIGIVMTRRPALAKRAADLGAFGLAHVFAFDSTGLGRSLDAHPGGPGVGTVISPGPVLTHISPQDRARIPRPLVAYGLIGTPERAVALLRLADAVVVRAEHAASVAAMLRRG